MFLPPAFPASGRKVKNIYCVHDSLINPSKALKSVSIVLGLLIATSSLPKLKKISN